ncbi:hypothetical protein B0H14DRAFT_2834545, partial [Mycena olivaceomarginata]
PLPLPSSSSTLWSLNAVWGCITCTNTRTTRTPGQVQDTVHYRTHPPARPPPHDPLHSLCSLHAHTPAPDLPPLHALSGPLH